MANREIPNDLIPDSLLNSKEKSSIEQKIEYEIAKSHYKMIKLGGITNILSGIFVIWVLYGHVATLVLASWYAILCIVNVINVSWAVYFASGFSDPEQLKKWRKGFYVIFALICLTWGSIGILFISENIHYQLYTMAFLLAVVIGFSFASATDFALALVSLTCLLVPTVLHHAAVGIHNKLTIGYDPALNLGTSIILFILGVFLLIVCFIGAKLVNRFFKLSFENLSLSEKLAGMNKFLEQRVKERTIKLENSLKLVTYQATHDLLTDLPNQRLLLKYTQSAIKAADHNSHGFCVVFFSLNELDKINDGLGHQVGDLVIQLIAKRFVDKFGKAENESARAMRYTITLSRKDVFVMLVDPITKPEEIETKVEELFSVLDEPVQVGKQSLRLTASIGVSLYPRDGKNITVLLMNADAARLHAKERGGNSINVYQSAINMDISKQLQLERNLHDAVKNKEFILHYQPFVDLKTGRICGMEALVRWNSPVLGFIPPDQFIPLAETNGMIIPLGEWVLRAACIQTKIWHDKGFGDLKIAINLSSKQLQQKNILQLITKILREANLDSHAIELELTETAAFQQDVIPVLKKFKEMGFSLSIDDFGTGYSGLTNIKLFTIDKLKIDKSFVRDVVTNANSQAIVSNTIALAKKINVSVLAEGVETKEQLMFLQEHGCDMIQGYYFSRPLDCEAFTVLLQSGKQFTLP